MIELISVMKPVNIVAVNMTERLFEPGACYDLMNDRAVVFAASGVIHYWLP